jgi:transcriptional regulator with XRE-family HTH domain
MDAMASAKDGLRALGNLIRSKRMAANLTQAQLGKRAGIVGKYVSEIERGTRDVPFSTLHAIVEDGLDHRLDVRFGAAAEGRAVKPAAPLPRSIEILARTIAELPPEPRAAVLATVRNLLRLVR